MTPSPKRLPVARHDRASGSPGFEHGPRGVIPTLRIALPALNKHRSIGCIQQGGQLARTAVVIPGKPGPAGLKGRRTFSAALGTANKHGAAPLQCGGYTLVRKAPGALCRPVVSVHRQHVGPFLKNGRTRACHRRPRAPVPSKTTVAFSGRSRPTYASHESSEAAWRAAMRPKTMFSALPPPEIP